MDESPTELYLPSSLPYPIKVVSLDAKPSSNITRGTRLLSYSFVYLSNVSEAQPETRFGTWDSAIEGKLSAWKVRVGDVVSHKKAKDKPAVVVIEPCKHGVQLGGLCVICGKDMTNVDYTGFSDASRASIQMTHSAFGPTVSLEEAQRIERETAEHLLKSRKLSLIVDLDQTIVHATVDPTVGDWIAEGEAWETRQADNAPSFATSQTTDAHETDDAECNPNWEALKDVKRFRLGPESFGPPSMRSAQRSKGKNKVVENEGCMYYIKPRPGWKEFLRDATTKYELHIYTMGTRAYAEEVCSAIDPEGSLFGRRILSRDESGSLTQKSLQRLFPCDTSMVVIIDDRADVWEWSPNLIKVIPYDFFVGIGDINSSFLPKVEPLTTSAPTPPPKSAVPNGLASSSKEAKTIGVDTSPVLPSAEEEERDVAELQATALLTQNNAVLEAQLEERPLAKKQEELQEHEVEIQKHQVQKAETPTTVPVQEPSPTSQKLPKKALLKNDDYELIRVGTLLNEVHLRFFAAYDSWVGENPRHRTGSSIKLNDVTRIIPRIRSAVFEGVHILFSSVIPLDTKPETTEIWRMAHMFGARCSTELSNQITHVVAAKRGTVKVDMARRRGGIKIVWLAWFSDSVALWQRQDEKPYLLDDPAVMPSASGQPPSSPTTATRIATDGGGSSDNQHSSQLDLDSDDWDQDIPEKKETGTLELGSINWDDINDEVEAAMNESDDGDDDQGDARSERSYGMQSAEVSEEEGPDGNSVTRSVTNSPRSNTRKRLRSLTPSDPSGGFNWNSEDDDLLRSPLAKRKKIAAGRTGQSALKQGISADELPKPVETASKDSVLAHGTPTALVSGGRSIDEEDEDNEDDSSSSDDSSDDEEDEEDDFLARALEEDAG